MGTLCYKAELSINIMLVKNNNKGEVFVRFNKADCSLCPRAFIS
jgi:hypothetical protein